MLKGWKIGTAGGVLVIGLFVYFNNTSAPAFKRPVPPTILAHRGIGQRYDIPIESRTCTAVHMLAPEHGFLENTLASMQAAFDRGADVVEFDIHPTTDGHFAVFHDRSLECKTNGHGLTREHTMAELKQLDIGYGYTFDGGHTYPFRGKGEGLMPSMDEVFARFPDRSFLVDVKSDLAGDAGLLVLHLARLPPARRARLLVFARGEMMSRLREAFPELGIFSTRSITSCLVRYIAYGWTGIISGSCYHSPLFIPINVAPWLWGWPNRFLNRMDTVQASIILMGSYPSSDISPGIDTLENLKRIPAGYGGGVWTNEVEIVAAALKRGSE